MAPLFSSGVKATSNAVLPFKCPSPKGSRHQSLSLTRLFYSSWLLGRPATKNRPQAVFFGPEIGPE